MRGSAALIKVCLAMEHGTLPGNLHYSEPNPNSASLVSGILQVSTWQPAGAAGFPCSGANIDKLHHAPVKACGTKRKY